MADSTTHPTLAIALLREHVGGRNKVSFHEITVDHVGFDRSTKHGGNESPTLFNMVVRYWLRSLSAVWKKATTRLQNMNGYKRRGRRSADIPNDIRGQLLHPGVEQKHAAGNGTKCDEANTYNPTWSGRRTKCTLRAGALVENGPGVHTVNDVNYRISRVLEMPVMGSLLSNEAETMSAMRHRMNKAMPAMRADMYFYENPHIPE